MGAESRIHPARTLAEALAALAAAGLPIAVVMVDGALVMPTAPVPEGFRDVRLKTPAGMVTVRRHGNELALVVFGNAGPELVEIRDRIAAALG
jgi:hypothetical protein